MIIVIIVITIIVIRITEVKVIIRITIIIIIKEIRIYILQGSSLGIGSLHIKVIVSNLEGRDYNSNIHVIVLL